MLHRARVGDRRAARMAGSRPARTSHQGAGLGLAIVASIAAIHGAAAARPRDGGGLAVTVTMPLARPRLAARPEPLADQSGG